MTTRDKIHAAEKERLKAIRVWDVNKLDAIDAELVRLHEIENAEDEAEFQAYLLNEKQGKNQLQLL